MTQHASTGEGDRLAGRPPRLLAILLAMAMFVLVVDTSLLNVSIAAVVHDLDTTAICVQSAIALEALVSAARPVGLQVALLIPLLAALLGLVNSIRMRRLPDPAPASTEGMVLG